MEIAFSPESFDTAFCVGSSQAYGTFRDALASLSKLTVSSGVVLIAEPYWRKTPSKEYLALLSADESVHTSHSENEAAGFDAGLIPLYPCTSSSEEWDHFEGLFCSSVERFCYESPDHLEAPAFRERIRMWRDGYRCWGRETLGFGFYLFLKP